MTGPELMICCSFMAKTVPFSLWFGAWDGFLQVLRGLAKEVHPRGFGVVNVGCLKSG